MPKRGREKRGIIPKAAEEISPIAMPAAFRLVFINSVSFAAAFQLVRRDPRASRCASQVFLLLVLLFLMAV